MGRHQIHCMHCYSWDDKVQFSHNFQRHNVLTKTKEIFSLGSLFVASVNSEATHVYSICCTHQIQNISHAQQCMFSFTIYFEFLYCIRHIFIMFEHCQPPGTGVENAVALGCLLHICWVERDTKQIFSHTKIKLY